jgi:hypothetical protein
MTAKKLGDKTKSLKFDSTIGSMKIKDIIFSIFTDYKDNKDEDSITRIEKPVIRQVSAFGCSLEIISGLFYHGNYGYKTILKDTRETDAATDLVREPYHAEEMPFYFSITLSEKSTKAIVCLQKFSHYGIKSVLDNIINIYNLDNGNITLELRPIVSGVLARNTLNNAVVNRIEIIKYETPDDKFDSFTTKRYQIDHVAKGLELTKDNMPAIFNKLIAFLSEPKEMSPEKFFDKDLLELVSHDGKDIDNIKISLNMNGKDRVFNFYRPNLFNISYDITESVKYSDTRFPDLESLEKICDDYVKENFSQVIQGQIE